LNQRILLLVSSFNSLTQRVFCALKEQGFIVSVEYAISDKVMKEAVELFKPKLILCPYLMQKIPKSIWEKIPVIIIHPGPLGDRGPNSLDLAILNKEDIWGVTALQANEQMDGGDIWGTHSFKMRQSTKASIYRREVSDLSIQLIREVLEKIKNKNFSPIPQQDIEGLIECPQKHLYPKYRQIDWNKDSCLEIINKINSADSNPGILDEIMGLTCYLYGAHLEGTLRGNPMEIIAKRDGAICLGCIDGAVWISHLKEPNKIKLPATFVLKDRLKGIQESRIPLFLSQAETTYKEIIFEKKEGIGYLSFNFYNGAMSSEQCIRLKYAIKALSEKVDILVLKGGEDFFSNGIHLNILEDSKKQGEDGWSNINAMNNLIETIIFCEDAITIASFGANAGAGGVFLGLACDCCVARENVILNPHYKTMGLSGSEFHTYTLFKRTDKKIAKQILDEALPINAAFAKKIKMIEKVLPNENYEREVEKFCKKLLENDEKYYDFLDEKIERLKNDESYIHECKENELKRMYSEFWDKNSDFHALRHSFVYKNRPTLTPRRIALHRKDSHA